MVRRRGPRLTAALHPGASLDVMCGPYSGSIPLQNGMLAVVPG